MKYKCEFEFKYDDFMTRKFDFVLKYKPKNLISSKRVITIMDGSVYYLKANFDRELNKCMEWIDSMSDKDLINLAKNKIIKNEKYIAETNSENNEFEDKLSKINKKLGNFKFEIEI